MENFENRYNYRFVYIPLVFVIYAIYYDLQILKYRPDVIYWLFKVFFILFPFICYFTKLIKESWRHFSLSLFWIIYCFYHVYNISIAYNTAFIQVAVAFSVMVTFNKREYLLFSFFMLIASSYSIVFSKNDFQYVALGMSSRTDVLINSLCLQGLCYLVYYYVTLPRLKLTDEEKRFAQYGKASSFLIHEISKPISRLKMNPDKVDEEIKQIQDVFHISKMINQKTSLERSVEQVSILSVYEEVISKYKKEIAGLGIKINLVNILDFEVKSDRRYIAIILDNLIKNAIEEMMGKSHKTIEVQIHSNKFSISNKILVQVKDPQLIGLTVQTTKDGHMGVGLFISRILCEKLSFSIDFNISDKLFTSTVTF